MKRSSLELQLLHQLTGYKYKVYFIILLQKSNEILSVIKLLCKNLRKYKSGNRRIWAPFRLIPEGKSEISSFQHLSFTQLIF